MDNPMFEQPTDYEAAFWKWAMRNPAVIAALFPFEYEIDDEVELC